MHRQLTLKSDSVNGFPANSDPNFLTKQSTKDLMKCAVQAISSASNTILLTTSITFGICIAKTIFLFLRPSAAVLC